MIACVDRQGVLIYRQVDLIARINGQLLYLWVDELSATGAEAERKSAVEMRHPAKSKTPSLASSPLFSLDNAAVAAAVAVAAVAAEDDDDDEEDGAGDAPPHDDDDEDDGVAVPLDNRLVGPAVAFFTGLCPSPSPCPVAVPCPGPSP